MKKLTFSELFSINGGIKTGEILENLQDLAKKKDIQGLWKHQGRIDDSFEKGDISERSHGILSNLLRRTIRDLDPLFFPVPLRRRR